MALLGNMKMGEGPDMSTLQNPTPIKAPQPVQRNPMRGTPSYVVQAAQDRSEAEKRFAATGDYEGLMSYLQKKYPGVQFGHSKSRFEKERMKYLGGQLRKEASDFESNVDKYAQDQYGLLKSDVDKNLSQGIDQTRKNYSARGLLYSGLRQDAEASQKGQAAGILAQGRAEINKDLRTQADAKKTVAANFGLQTYQMALDNARELDNIQMQNAIARRRAARQIGQGIGYAAGAYFGSQDSGSGGGNPGGGHFGTYMGPDTIEPF